MKPTTYLQRVIARLLLVALFLQSCNNNWNTPEPQSNQGKGRQEVILDQATLPEQPASRLEGSTQPLAWAGVSGQITQQTSTLPTEVVEVPSHVGSQVFTKSQVAPPTRLSHKPVENPYIFSTPLPQGRVTSGLPILPTNQAEDKAILTNQGDLGEGKTRTKGNHRLVINNNEAVKDTKQEEQALGRSSEEKVSLATPLSPQAVSTLCHMGKVLGEESYTATALMLLEEQAVQGDVTASQRLIKKLGKLGMLASLREQQATILPISWREKSLQALQDMVTQHYQHALAQLSSHQESLSASEQRARELSILQLKYHYAELIGAEASEHSGLLKEITNGLDQLALKKLPTSLSFQRIYLSYLVKAARRLDLENNMEELRTYMEYVAEQIAKKAKDASKAEKDKVESKALQRLSAKHYRKLGDLAERFRNHQGSHNIGKSDEWQRCYYLQATKLQDPIANYRLGLLYERPGGLHEDNSKAQQAFEESAQQGYSLAEHQLALYHEKEGNAELAKAWHERAASQGHPLSLYALYLYASKGDGSGQAEASEHLANGFTYLVQAAQAGHAQTQYELGNYYWQQKQYEQAIKWYEKAAQQGIYEAYAYLGVAAAKGLGRQEDPESALDYYVRAEKIGDNPLARYGRSRLYEKGKGVVKNLVAALNLYTGASLLGYAKAAYHAGRFHLVGEVAGSNPKQAYEFLKKAAQGNVYKACLLLGRMQEYGWGGTIDLEGAISWYQGAASGLNQDVYSRAQALYQLGWLHRLGKGVEANEATALSYFEQAAIVGKDKYVQLQKDLQEELKRVQEESKNQQSQQEGAYKKLQEEKQLQATTFKKAQEEKETVYKKLQEEQEKQLGEKEAAYKKLQEELKKLQEESKNQQSQQEGAYKQLEEKKQLQETTFKKEQEEKETVYKRFQAEKEKQLAEKEAAYKKLQEELKKLQEESKNQQSQQEGAYKKLQEEKQLQEKTFKKEQEEKFIQETQRIGEVMQKVAGDPAKLDEAIKAIAPHGEDIVKRLANNGTYFNPCTNSFTETDMSVLVNHPRFKQLTSIDLSGRKLSAASLKVLASHLKEVPNLKTLDLRNNQLEAAGMQALAPYLQGLANLQILDLYGTQLGATGIQALAPYLEGLSNLQELNLYSNRIGVTGMQALAPHLKGLTSLKKLRLGGNQLGPEGMEALVPCLQRMVNLQELRLEENQLGLGGIQALVPHLQGLTNIQRLYLYSNQMDGTSMQVLAPYLKDLTNLQELLLSHNQLGITGMQALAPHLKLLKSLHSVGFYNCQLGDEGVKVLAAHMEGLTNLQSLDLQNNQLGDAGVQALSPNLKFLKNLQSLSLHGNKIGNAAIQALVPYLKELTNLQSINLSNNQIGDEGAEDLGQHLQEVQGRTIYLSDNNISSVTQEKLKKQCPGISWSF